MPIASARTSPPDEAQRLQSIARARNSLLHEHRTDPGHPLSAWVERSWQRCLARGMTPEHEAPFEQLSPQSMRHTAEANAQLVHTARPLLQHLGRAIVDTGYFAILTNQDGVVVDVGGRIDLDDRRASLITRVGTDLSEASVGTTAIGTALTEQQPVWLHRGEHFFANTTVYSCAGAPLRGPQGECVGMLDVTGIDVRERPELKHLVAQVASRIENALLLAQPHSLTVRLNWPGNSMGSDADGIVCVDRDGWITGANPAAHQMLGGLPGGPGAAVHVSDVFGLPYEMLFDAVRRSHAMLEVPLWSGLRLQALPMERHHEAEPVQRSAAAREARPLKDVEADLIRDAVAQARGNVAQAAQTLGISRATVYRKLGRKPPH